MHYSPILAPVLAMFLISQIASISIVASGAYGMIKGDRPPPQEEIKARFQELFVAGRNRQLMGFYVVGLSLALMGTGRNIDYWVAWSYVAAWTAAKVAIVRGQREWHLRFAGIVILIQFGLAFHAGWRLVQSGSLSA